MKHVLSFVVKEEILTREEELKNKHLINFEYEKKIAFNRLKYK